METQNNGDRFLMVVVFVFCLFGLMSCCHGPAWWLGIKPPQLPQQVVTNMIGIKKVDLSSTAIKEFNTELFPEWNHSDAMENFYKATFGTSWIWHYERIAFAGSDYHVALNDNREIIFAKDGHAAKIVKSLPLPRKVWSFVPIIMQRQNEKYLMLVVQNSGKSNSSLLFILDKRLNVVYEEHALHAYEIGTYKDKQYGDCVIVKIGKFHPHNEKGDEKYFVYCFSEKY